MLKFYKPARSYIIIDLLLIVISVFLVLDWLPLSTKTPFGKYSLPAVYYLLAWFSVSYLFKRYYPIKYHGLESAVLRLFVSSVIVFALFMALIHIHFRIYSGYVLLTVTASIFVVNNIYLLLLYAFKFASDYNEIIYDVAVERKNAAIVEAPELDIETADEVKQTILNHSGEAVYDYLNSMVRLDNSGTRVFMKANAEALRMGRAYKYSAIVQLERLNNTHGVNKMFFMLNQKLPDNGLFICCFQSKSSRKKSFLVNYPKGINYMIYTLYFMYKRVLPKTLFLSKIYYFITRGKNRIFSKAEVFGRLYSMGFRIIEEKKINGLTYVVAQRVKHPALKQKKVYGPIITLNRFGKNREMFKVYKMRTMHPYSEYLQAYIYEKNSLQEGGKFNHDIRVTTLGGFMRKYWMDELPMILNLLKMEMKIVGVRPLSAQYFNLYSPELQQLRVQFKPGLLPPFYADMPKTLDDIQASEMRYLTSCKEKGVFYTDLRYIFLILKNILFKKARSK